MTDGSATGPLPWREKEYNTIAHFICQRILGKHSKIMYICGGCGGGKTTTMKRISEAAETAIAAPLLAESPLMLAKRRRPVFHFINCADRTGIDILDEMARAFRKRSSGAKNGLASKTGGKAIAELRAIAAGQEGEALEGATARFASQEKKTKAQNKNNTKEALGEASKTSCISSAMHVFVLDEPEFIRGSNTALRQAAETAVGLASHVMTMILISNARGSDASNILPLTMTQELTFPAYTTEQLSAIARNEFQTNQAHEFCGAFNKNVATTRAVLVGTSAFSLRNAAAEIAAKTASNLYGGDARKAISMCQNAKMAGLKRTRDEAATMKEVAEKDDKSAKGVTPLQVQVTAADVVNSTKDAPSTNVPLIAGLPPQMLFVLCCAVNLSQQIKKEAQMQNCGLPSISMILLFQSYQRLMQHLHLPTLSLSSVRETVSNLADVGLVTPLQKKGGKELFALCGTASEVEVALKQQGYMFVIGREIVQSA